MNEGVYGETNGEKGGRKNKEKEQHREGEARQRQERQGSGGKTTKREKRRSKICNENEGRREVSSKRGLIEEGGRYREKKRYVDSEKEEMGRKR